MPVSGKKKTKQTKQKTTIGWEEWCAFPELNLPAIKAKVDTGAKTSSLHAFNIKTFKRMGKKYVQFKVHPVQRTRAYVRTCEALVVDYRYVMNSGGQKEKRYVILTPLTLGGKNWEVEMTLTKRDNMAFRMLLGREAMRQGVLIVDPAKSCLQGKILRKEAIAMYK